MRQTLELNYGEEKQLSSDAIIIGAHCNSQERVDRCIELITRLRVKYPEYAIILCSHISIDQKLFDLVDYFVYNKNNATINYHIIDKRLDWRVFAIYQPGINQEVRRAVQNNGYAHYVQVYDGLTIANGQKMKKMHYMSYDVSFDVVNRISMHRDFLDHYEVVNYTFREDRFISSEFFSITDIGSEKSILKNLTFDDYYNLGNGEIGTEDVYANIFNDCNVKTLGFFHNDDRKDPWVIGDFTAMPLLTDQSKVSMLPTSIDGLIIIPYDDPNEFGKTILCIANGYYYENDGKIDKVTLTFLDDDMNVIDEKHTTNLGLHYWAQYYPDINVKYVKVFVDDVFRLTFDLRNRKNYGWILNG